MILLGSTGIGKTAILRMLEQKFEHCESIELLEMSMNYISNSDTINFLRGIDVDLSLFFQSLWRHVLCVEFIKMAVPVQTEEKSQFFITRIYNSYMKDQRKEKFVKFVKENEHKFWNTMDQTVLEITENLTKQINGELGSEVAKSVAKAGYARSLSAEKREHFQQRARKFVDSQLLADLSHVVTGLSEYMKDHKEKYYILIDRLDEHWTDPSLKFTLIQSLFEAIKGLRKIRNFKVIVALRTDVYEKTIRDSKSSMAQVEKNEDLILRMNWTKDQLWQLIDKRMNFLFRKKYSKENVHFSDVFPEKIDSKINTWNYMIERTLLRPRDVITFTNSALNLAEGRTSISKNALLNAEKVYSDNRREALVHEWRSLFPGASVYLDLLRGRPAYWQVSHICSKDLVETLFERLGSDAEYMRDPLWLEIEASTTAERTPEPLSLAQEVCHRLHLMGAVGLKVSHESPWQWFFRTQKPVKPASISADTKVEIHQMLHAALGIGTRHQEQVRHLPSIWRQA